MRLGGPLFQGDVREPAEWIRRHRRLGFSAAYAPYIPDPSARAEFRHALAEADLLLAEYGAYCLNISHPDERRREEHIAEITLRLRRAEEMGARCCVMHGGSYNGEGCVKAHPENFSPRNIEHNVRTIQRILDEVRPEHTKLVLETESYVLPDGPDLYLQMLRDIDRPGFAVHLDPVNITLSPRRVYYSGDFIRECFAKLGPHIVSCHAKDTNLMDHATVQITETYLGNGTLDYGAYLSELDRLHPDTTLMIEHLRAEQLPAALRYVFAQAEGLGLAFHGAEAREAL